jgi:hypothetical protein
VQPQMQSQPQLQPQVQPQPQPQLQPTPAAPCPPGYQLNTSNAPGYNISTIVGIGTSYCYQELSRPGFNAFWPSCPTGSTQLQIDALNENCYVPATQ